MIDPGKKRLFHRRARGVLREIAKRLELKPGAYEIRTNPAGPAILGETTLHAEKIYVQISAVGGDDARVLYRSCVGRKDYVGGANQWMPLSWLHEQQQQAVAAMRAVMDRA